MYTIQIIQHFYVADEQCGGDYYSVTIEVNGEQIMEFGDYYHDKGEESANGWVGGFIYAMGQVYKGTTPVEELETKCINDITY